MLDQEQSTEDVDGKTSFSMVCWRRYLYTLPWLDKADQIGSSGERKASGGSGGSIVVDAVDGSMVMTAG